MYSAITHSITYARDWLHQLRGMAQPPPPPPMPIHIHPRYSHWYESLRFHIGADNDLIRAIVDELRDPERIDRLVDYLVSVDKYGTRYPYVKIHNQEYIDNEFKGYVPRIQFERLVANIASGRVPWCTALMHSYVAYVCRYVDVGVRDDPFPYAAVDWTKVIISLVELRHPACPAMVPLYDHVVGSDPLLFMIKAILGACGRLWTWRRTGGTQYCTEQLNAIVDKGDCLFMEPDAKLARQVLFHIRGQQAARL